MVFGRSMNGMMKLRPGERTLWKRPRRSTTRVSDWGTTFTPAEIITIARITNTAERIIDNVDICVIFKRLMFFIQLLMRGGAMARR